MKDNPALIMDKNNFPTNNTLNLCRHARVSRFRSGQEMEEKKGDYDKDEI
jgi:hypothetical protein